MGTEADKKFTWVIKNFSSLQSEFTCSETFVIGGCKWRLMAGEKNENSLSLHLCVADYKTLSYGWKRHIKYRFPTNSPNGEGCFNQYLCPDMISLPKLNAKKGGFVVNDEVKIVVEIDVLEVIGKSDVTQPLKKTKLNHDGAVNVNGFQVLPSQAESVKRIFEKHPDIALEFRAKNLHLRTSCINLLLNLIETFCQSLQNLSIDELSQAEKTLAYMKSSGFKVDWLELKLEQVKKTKMEWQIGESRVLELEEELKVFKQKCSDIEALLEKEKEELKDSKQKCSDIEGMLEEEKAKVLAATRAPPLTLDDVV